MTDPRETVVPNERLALIAIQSVAAQQWEIQNLAAECLARRIATQAVNSRKSPARDPPSPPFLPET